MTCALWQVERRKRTRHLIELGGHVIKAGIVDLTGDDAPPSLARCFGSSSRAIKANGHERYGPQGGSRRSRRTHMGTDQTVSAVRRDARQWHVSRATEYAKRRSSMRWALEAGRQNSRSAERIPCFARSKSIPIANAKTSVMSVRRPRRVSTAAPYRASGLVLWPTTELTAPAPGEWGEHLITPGIPPCADHH
jgi:hypothetical protein